MEAVLCPLVPNLPEFESAVRKFASAALPIVDAISKAFNKRKVKKAVDEYLLDLNDFINFVPEIMARLDVKPRNAAQTQAHLVYCTGLRKVLWLVEEMLFFFKNENWLNSRQFKHLKKAKSILTEEVNKADAKIFSFVDTPDTPLALKYRIGSSQLAVPLRVFIEDDDTGKHVSCLEYPMLYGFGETESEAMEMLDREILSLCEDSNTFDDLPEEYTYAAILAEMAMKSEK